MSVETNPHNYTNMNNIFSQFFKPAPNSPKEISGANGKFLPKPPPATLCVAMRAGLLFHLRHPNSKTNEPKFWQILFLQKLYTFHILNTKRSRSCESVPHFLTPQNSFAKTSSALFRHLPETLRAEHQRKMSFPFSRKNSPPPNQRSKEHFSLVLPSEARQWRNDSFHIGIFLEKSSDFVQETQPRSEVSRDHRASRNRPNYSVTAYRLSAAFKTKNHRTIGDFLFPRVELL